MFSDGIILMSSVPAFKSFIFFYLLYMQGCIYIAKKNHRKVRTAFVDFGHAFWPYTNAMLHLL